MQQFATFGPIIFAHVLARSWWQHVLPMVNFSSHAHWLDSTTVVMMVWIFSVRFYQPDSLGQENVPQFPLSLIQRILFELGDEIPAHPHVRSVVAEEEEEEGTARGYAMLEHTLCPTQLGIPSRRMRQYTAFHLFPFIRLDPTGPALSFIELFYKELACTAAVYLDGIPAEYKELEQFAMASARKAGASGSDPTKVDPMEAMSPSDCARLDGFRIRAAKQKLVCTTDCGKQTWTCNFALANVSQRSEYYKAIDTNSAPILLTSSMLYDLVKAEPLVPSVLWLIQGFPHPMARGVCASLKADFPRRDLVNPAEESSLTWREQQTLMGNDMHLAAMGAWHVYSMSCSDKAVLRTVARRPAPSEGSAACA